jgi:D-glycero-D-manno-heptose 1,7-bisphosphate phosphatase
MTKMIIVDRDGVINQDLDDPIKWKEESMPIASSLEAISQLKKAGYYLTIATHQPDIARGLFSERVIQNSPEAANVPVDDDRAHFVHNTLNNRPN